MRLLAIALFFGRAIHNFTLLNWQLGTVIAAAHQRKNWVLCDTRLEWATNTTHVGQSTAHGSCQAATPAHDSPLGGVLWGAHKHLGEQP